MDWCVGSKQYTGTSLFYRQFIWAGGYLKFMMKYDKQVVGVNFTPKECDIIYG